MILEGEAEGNNNYFVILTDENGNVIPNATLTSEHIGECFTAMVANECNAQSCWSTICVEDKIATCHRVHRRNGKLRQFT
jgi:hypothetical protein